VARAVLAQASECPAISIDGAQQVMSVRAVPDAAFPVLVCEQTIPADASSVSLENSPLPVPRPALKSIAAFGDTGCRLKSAKTAAREGDTDDDDARGKFQDCNNPALWPFAQVAQSVADAKPDLVIHVGDYLYREAACPDGDAGCARSPYGDDWPTWKADFFAPAAPALRAAPWIVVRGNHEICRRAGPGYFRLLDPTPARTTPAQSPPPCVDLIPQFTVTLGEQSFIVLDSSNAADVCPCDPASYAAQFAAMKPKSGTWLLTHRPVWGFGPRRRILNATLQEALANWSGNLPEGMALALAGHIHVVEVLSFPTSAARNSCWAPVARCSPARSRPISPARRSQAGGWPMAVPTTASASRCSNPRRAATAGPPPSAIPAARSCSPAKSRQDKSPATSKPSASLPPGD
jgi:hypothetical protein